MKRAFSSSFSSMRLEENHQVLCPGSHCPTLAALGWATWAREGQGELDDQLNGIPTVLADLR